MNILTIGTTDSLGGAAKVSQDICEALEAQGHTVSMFVADKVSNNPHVRVIPRSFWRKCLGFLLGTERFISTDWILDTIEFKNADLIHCHNIHGRYFNLATLQKMSRMKPVVWTLHDEWALTPHCAYTLEGTDMRNGLYTCPSIQTAPRLLWDNSERLSRERVRIYANTTLHIVTPSKWLLDKTNNTVLKGQDVRYIPNGVATSAFTQRPKSQAREELDLPQDKKIVLFLATDAKNNTWKGWKYTAEIIERYRDRDDVLFLCVGNMTHHTPEPNVMYVGRVQGAEALSRYYSAADVLLFTSIAENFPLVILEAMSCGLPIVSFDVGGVKEAVSSREHGYIAEYTSIEDIARGLAWALSLTPEEQRGISEKSALRVREYFELSQMTDRYIALYTELISAHEDRPAK